MQSNFHIKNKESSNNLSIAIVLVDYNTAEETFACLQSIHDADQGCVDVKVYVVDNSDKVALPNVEGVTVLTSGCNIGLSPAWALAFKEIRKLDFDYVIFMNNDVKISKFFFTELASGINRWGDDCVFGGRIYRMDNPDVVWSRGGSIDACKVIVRHDDCDVHKSMIRDGDFETGHISGCCMVISVEQLEKIGGPDPDFFFRGEEWDLNYRLMSAGFRLVILDNMELWHAVNASHDRFSPDMLYLAYRAKVLFARKHHSLAWFIVWYVFGFLFAAAVAPDRLSKLSKKKNSWSIRRALLLAFVDGLRWRTIKPRVIF